ncbi:putative Ig domain-containing protein [Dactylosporangium sp. NPDC005572]|uniref:putative Ig domain-containing protein n=1 Tax=Dactylosporangium sp. NPDC005572 TaxID=3156889 RepID=UPI0033B39C87
MWRFPHGGRQAYRRITAAALTLVVAAGGAVLVSPERASAFSSALDYKVHQEITSVLGCPPDPGPFTDCFQPESLQVLLNAVAAPDSLLSGETQSSAHCDNGDYVPAADAAAPETVVPLLRRIWTDPRLSDAPGNRGTMSQRRQLIYDTVRAFLAKYSRFARITLRPRFVFPQSLLRLWLAPGIPAELRSEQGQRTRLAKYLADLSRPADERTLTILFGVWSRPPYDGVGQSEASAAAAIADCVTRTRARTRSAVTAATTAAGDTYPPAGPGVGPSCTDIAALNPGDAGPALPARTAKCTALYQLGRALHTIQDFYAHSNWVDPPGVPGQPLLLLPAGLNRTTPTDLFDPAAAYTGAAPVIERGLVTGCYPTDSRPDCTALLYHGTTRTTGLPEPWALAKDDTRFDKARALYSRRAGLDTAKAVAREATLRHWRLLQQLMLDRAGSDPVARATVRTAICVLTHDQPAGCAQQTPPLAITTAALPDGTTGKVYPEFLVTASGGTAPYSWSATGLPAGLTLDRGGRLTGTPATAGTTTVTLTVRDGLGFTATATRSLTIRPAVPTTVVDLPLNATMATAGPDGRIWVTAWEDTLTQPVTLIKAVDTGTMQVQTYAPLAAGTTTISALGNDLAFDGAGHLWMVGSSRTPAVGTQVLVRFIPATRAIAQFPLPTGCRNVHGLFRASDGYLWMRCVPAVTGDPNALVRMAPDGTTTRIPLTAAGVVNTNALAAGADGSVWAPAPGTGGILQVTRDGRQALYPDSNGLGTTGVVGDGSAVIEVGLCPLKLSQYCSAPVAANGTQGRPTPMADPVEPLISDLTDGTVWAIGMDTTGRVSPTGLYTFQATAGPDTLQSPFSLPVQPPLLGLLAPVQGRPGVQHLILVAGGRLWLVHDSPVRGSLLGVPMPG